MVLIYSKWGKIETVDHVRKLKYTQSFAKLVSGEKAKNIILSLQNIASSIFKSLSLKSYLYTLLSLERTFL